MFPKKAETSGAAQRARLGLRGMGKQITGAKPLGLPGTNPFPKI